MNVTLSFKYHRSKLSSGLFHSIHCATAKFPCEGGHFGKNHQDLISLQLQIMSLVGGFYVTLLGYYNDLGLNEFSPSLKLLRSSRWIGIPFNF